MKKRNGFGVIEIIIVISVIGFIAGFIWYASNGKKSDSNTFQVSNTASPEISSPKLSKYNSSELAVSMTYPADWGDASMIDGPLISPQRGSYKQLIFSKEKRVSINFVTSAYSSPLDGCGLGDPVKDVQHELYARQASVIGWKDDYVLRYMTGPGFNGPTSYKSYKTQDNVSIWQEIAKKDKVLIYKNTILPQNVIKETVDGICGSISKSQAEEANAFSKYYNYAVNLSGSKFLGVNAEFDARKDDDEKVRDQVMVVLNSINI